MNIFSVTFVLCNMVKITDHSSLFKCCRVYVTRIQPTNNNNNNNNNKGKTQDKAITDKIEQLSRAIDRLSLLHAHDQ